MDTIIITTRKATIDDLATLYGFEQGVIAAERPYDPTLKDGEIHYYNLAEMIGAPHIELLVAEFDNSIIASGYARIEHAKPFLKHPAFAYLGFMYVRPEFRGRGVNQIIIAALKQWARSQHISEIRLEVYNNNSPAIKAYEKIGFKRLLIEMRLNLDEE
jgi:GNAT superfamily N-acetyltransferase